MADIKVFNHMLNRFEQYAVQKSWMGGSHPSTWESTKSGYDVSRADLFSYFKSCFDELKERKEKEDELSSSGGH